MSPELPDQSGRDADGGDIQERQDLDFRALNSVAVELIEVKEAAGSGIDRGCHPGIETAGRIDTKGTASIPVPVEINESRT